MLYIFCGDRLSSRDNAKNLVDVCRKKRPDAIYIKISTESEISPEEILYNQSLFDVKHIVFIDEISKSKDIFDKIEGKVKEYCGSEDMFVMFEPDLDSKVVSKFEKKGAIVKVYKKKDREDFNSNAFKLLDIIVKKDKKESFFEITSINRERYGSRECFEIVILADESYSFSERVQECKRSWT